MEARAKIVLEGIVQGVGFRPFVHRLAKSFNLRGFVLNSTTGVIIEVEGDKERLLGFYKELIESPPPQANIIKRSIEYHKPIGLKSFKIKESQSYKDEYTVVSPDIGICKECLLELFDPNDRRFRYPFINCTNCGPRFTIIEDIPYDRKVTTMKRFKMCKECEAEYRDITNRRYHAEPNACHACGPRVWLSDGEREIESYDPIRETIRLLKDGYIIAIKGIGGFHLACNAEDDRAVERLRKRKRRREKPFAIMVKDSMLRRYCYLDEEEEHLLYGPKRPIVLLRKKENSSISPCVAPKNKYLGVMLPYTPLHYLLMDDKDLNALVMTSGNLANKPLTKDNKEAEEGLSGIADYILMHNRDIYNRCDDSVTQIVDRKEVIIRRSRGYVPSPIHLEFELMPTIGLGAELKSTFCLACGDLAFLSQHIGDLKNLETLEFFKEGIFYFKRLFRTEPELIAHDLHPDYLSTQLAFELKALNPGLKTFGIQHHHAHIASVMAENNINEKVIGISLDGIGYGTDGHIWGCESLLADYLGFERIAHLKYIPMPGGDKATCEPYRMAISYLYSVYGEDIPLSFFKRWGKERILFILRMIEHRINSPLTSSIGRLFDGVASIIGITDTIDYEAQAAIELEMLVSSNEEGEYGFEIIKDKDLYIIDPGPIIIGIINDLDKVSLSAISSKFHNTVVRFILDICRITRERTGIEKVVLSGGVFQNRYILGKTYSRLLKDGFIPILNRSLPSNDGGISLGQAVIASKICKS